MTIERRCFTEGTYVTTSYPWGLYSLPGRALCSDGVVRALARISGTADTFFSIPASVKVSGRTVSGYVTFQTRSDELIFVAHQYGRNGHLLPRWEVA